MKEKNKKINMTEKEFKYHKLYMDIALRCADMSYAVRKKVGSIIVKDGRILSHGWNGMPSGCDNECEIVIDGKLTTKPDVIHAESNALTKLARSTESSEGATLYITLSPCVDCAKLASQCGISTVVFKEIYRDIDGIKKLESRGIKVVHLDGYNTTE